MSRPAPDERSGCGDHDEGFGDGSELLVVAGEASAFHDPGECALDDPASTDDDEAFHPRCASYDFQRDVGLVRRPFDGRLYT